ncbi:hypothetical protein L2Y96_19245 [Luteibacter aegosomaticola]|uniref:hypothetical protein n=1 Tax=Luteibacter aegosomaticola TaxID=2911538 RepID=UPI001FF8E4AA|nr:hypothetical protein [Luteibacter aegosomaticola]UPG89509.1 hypothetical protein L2Y96_19245 [Luteibacter aegosomaticola]
MTDVAQGSAASAEQTFLENAFGTVTSKRLVFFRAKGWLSGGSRQDIPLQHVTSVRLDITRSIVGGLFLVLVGLGCLGSGNAILTVGGLLAVFFGVLLLWGSPTVVVNTAGQDLNVAKGWPWVRSEAGAFVESLRGQLFRS